MLPRFSFAGRVAAVDGGATIGVAAADGENEAAEMLENMEESGEDALQGQEQLAAAPDVGSAAALEEMSAARQLPHARTEARPQSVPRHVSLCCGENDNIGPGTSIFMMIWQFLTCAFIPQATPQQ